jgi:hypothetical protein
MAKKRRSAPDTTPVSANDELIHHLNRIANLLAALAVKGESQTDKIVTLAAVGFTPTEISQLLGTTANTVAVTVHKHRKRKSKPRRSSKTD